jgi:hypothetical protein
MVALLGASADASPAAPLLPHQGFAHTTVTAERPPPPPACSTPMARARADATAAMDASAHELLRWLQVRFTVLARPYIACVAADEEKNWTFNYSGVSDESAGSHCQSFSLIKQSSLDACSLLRTLLLCKSQR